MPTRLSDRGGVAAAYAAGGVLVIAVTVIMAWLVWQGISTISWDFLTTGPAPGSLEQGVAGGILPALVGTLFRNGPGRFERGGKRYAHMLDGDGGDGRGCRFRWRSRRPPGPSLSDFLCVSQTCRSMEHGDHT